MPRQTLVARFDGSPAGLPVVRFQISKAFAKHTVGTLDLKYGDANTPTAGIVIWPEWTPVTLELVSGSDRDEWFGYVHHGGTESDNRLGASVVRYTVIGTSLPLNEQRTRSWSNVSRSGIARMVARQHRLRSVIERDLGVQPYVAQPGNSDWQLLKGLADDCGYRLWVDGSTLLFVNPETLLLGVRAADIRTYTHNATPGSADTVAVWKTQRGSMLPRAGGQAARHVVTGLDTRTGRIVKAVGTNTLGGPTEAPSLTSIGSQRVASQTAAQRAVGAAVSRSRGWVTARATVSCSPSLRPGSVIEVTGEAIPADERGLWLVTEVEHRVTLDGSTPMQFVSELGLERNDHYGVSFRSEFRTINTADTVPATIRNGVYWEALVMEDIRVG